MPGPRRALHAGVTRIVEDREFMQQPVIDLVYFNAGGGHRAAAQALQQVLAEQRRPWTVRLVNLTDVLDPAERLRRLTGFRPEDFYNRRLARGWTIGLAKELKLLQAMIRLGHSALVRLLQQHWLATEPDLVVSLIPNFNRALHASLASSLPGVPFVTVLTDLADLPPHFWIEPGQPDQHIVCGTPRALAQGRAAGHPRERLHLVSGMLLRPSFYRVPAFDRAAELGALGLDPRRPTGVVLFGGQGSPKMLTIAKALRDRQLLLLCGHNDALAARLRAMRPHPQHAVLGHTGDVARYMALADYFIGKPGPGSLSEALRMGLPVITFGNAWTLPQERYNTEWVREQRVGVVLSSVRQVRAASDTVIAELPTLRERVRRIDNRAVFEIPEILASVLHGAALPDPLGPGRYVDARTELGAD